MGWHTDGKGRWLAAGYLLLCLAGTALATLTNSFTRLTADVSCEIGSVSFSDKQVVSIGATKPGAIGELSFPGAEHVGIDALMVLEDRIVFSPDVDCSIDGTDYADEDLIAYDVNDDTYSYLLDGSYYFIPERANLDAACLRNITNLYISIDVSIEILTVGWVHQNDILLVTPGGIPTVAFDGTDDLNIPPHADIDALYYDGTNVYYSLDITCDPAGVLGTHNDVWCYNTVSHNTVLLSNFPLNVRVDLAALDAPTDTDGDWLTDFEEATGMDEAATTFPDTSSPLKPNGNISDSMIADSDGDTFSDGEEAACGTNPTNALDYLRVTSIENTPEGAVVTWASVDGKLYDFQAGTSMVHDGVTLMNNIEADGPSTAFTNDSGTEQYFYRVRLEPEP